MLGPRILTKLRLISNMYTSQDKVIVCRGTLECGAGPQCSYSIQLYVSNCTKSSSDFPWINKCSKLTALVTTKCSIFYKSFFDMDFNSVGVRNGQVAPPNHEKISLIILHTVDSVPSQCGRLAVKCPLVMKWSLGSSDFGREAGHSTAQHSLP